VREFMDTLDSALEFAKHKAGEAALVDTL
jgi:hypothetical protein